METGRDNLTLMLVDDDPDNHEIMEIACTGGQFEFEIEHLYDGTQFLDFVDGKTFHEKPDFVLLDLNMPKVTGWEVLEKLKARAKALSFPIYVLTTVRDIDSEELAIRLGARNLFTKPDTISQLKHLVESISARLVRGRAFQQAT
jgi:CheY-like chemotaxis protein